MNCLEVEGRDHGRIVVYALSTCMWCKMVKTLLRELGVAYCYIDVDKLEPEEKARVKEEVRRWNPEGSYPTLVIDDRECISGYAPQEIKARLA